ncbi:DNA replication protein, partial [Sinorhizobium meliloti]
MSEIRALIEQLIAAGVDPIEAAEVVARAAIHGAANAPKQRSAGAIRQERYRRNKASQVTESDGCDAGDEPSSPEGSSPTPP